MLGDIAFLVSART